MIKTGRPTGNSKFDSISLRLNSECVEILEKLMINSTLSKSEWIRRGIKMLKLHGLK